MIQEGMVGVIPTDTIYGIVSSIYYEEAVDRVYKVKRRNRDKPCIVLIDKIERLSDLGVDLAEDKTALEILESVWPGPVSIIFEVREAPWHLTRGTYSMAFRLPNNDQLLEFLKVSGPVIAPSANVEGMGSAISVQEAGLYFGNEIDFYVDEGERPYFASRLVKISDGDLITLR